MVDMISQLLLYFCIGPVRTFFSWFRNLGSIEIRGGMDNFPTFSGVNMLHDSISVDYIEPAKFIRK